MPALTNLLATTGASAGQIALTWDAVGGASGYRIERSLDGVGGWSTVYSASGATTGFTDSGLAAQTRYFYRVYATNSAGTSDVSNVASATTLGVAAPTVPVAPAGLKAALNKNKVRLTWTDLSNNESSFRIERSTDGVHWAYLAQSAANATSYNDTVSRGSVYYYRVCAVNAAGSSAWSGVAMASVGNTAGKADPIRFSDQTIGAARSWDDLSAPAEKSRDLVRIR